MRVNGKALGTLWLGPWTVDVTGAVQPGRNTLEVEVVNAWNNRLVGDANLPADQRRTFLAAKTVDAKAPLRSAGLLGPVVIRTAVPVKVPGPVRSRMGLGGEDDGVSE